MLRLLPEEEYPEDHARPLAFLECWCQVPQVVSQEGLVVGVPQDLEFLVHYYRCYQIADL